MWKATDKRLTAIEEDVGTLKENLATIKEDVNTLKEDVGTIKTDVDILKTDVDILKTSTGSLEGSDLERRARETILNIAKDELGLTKGSILVARGRVTAPAFLESIEGAEENGLITGEQESKVLFADIILRARRTQDRKYVHAVFEVSRTIRNNDVERAAESAAAVTAATGQENHRRRHRGEDPAATAGTGGENRSPRHFASNVQAEQRGRRAGGLTAPRQKIGNKILFCAKQRRWSVHRPSTTPAGATASRATLTASTSIPTADAKWSSPTP